MPTAAIFAVMAAVPAGNSAPLTAVLHTPGLHLVFEVRTPTEIRKAYHKASRLANPGKSWDPFEAAPELIRLYREVNHPAALPAGERIRKRRALKAKLERVRDRLKLMLVREKREIARRRYRERLSRKHGREPKPSAAGGGGVAANAARLIALIQNTIAPHTWNVNGGNGSISFLGNPFYVLVVRASGEVHHQIGGVLGR